MKNLLPLFMALNVGGICLAQTTSPAVIISSGTLTKGEDASLSWTIGESLIESYGEEDLMLLQGFQETEEFAAAIEDGVFNNDEVWVYPTSTRTLVNVLFKGETDGRITGEIVDMSGKVLSIVKLPDYQNEINLEDYSCGVYLLRITLADKRVTETRIIKY
jgi:hypothetical protein